MDKKTIVYECIEQGGERWWQHSTGGWINGFKIGDTIVSPYFYPIGTRLTVEITKPDAQDAVRLNDNAAAGLNTYMNGGE